MSNDVPEESTESADMAALRREMARILERLERLEASLSEEEKAQNHAASFPALEKFVPRGDYDAVLNHAQALAANAREQHVEHLLNSALRNGQIIPANADYYRAMCRTDDGIQAFEKFVKVTPSIFGNPTGLDGKRPPGQGDDSPALQFAANAQVREEFGTLERYAAFRRAQDAGLVVSVKKEGA